MRARVVDRLGPGAAVGAAALVRASALASALAACGAGSAPAPAGRAAPASLAAPAESSGDLVVATVAGRPVWASCVVQQARRGAAPREAALAECIDFELLAQAAEARGLAAAPEVAEAARGAAASRLVETAFEDRYRAPSDLKDIVDPAVDRAADQMDKPELRGSAFARIEVPKDAPPEVDAAARALAERIAAALAGEAGLFPNHLQETADRLAAEAGLRVSHGTAPVATRERLVKDYREPLFAIPEVGRVSPAVRTPWGWDVILLTHVQAPRVYTREEVGEQMFPDLRRRYFQVWVNQIVKSLGATIEVHPELLAREDGEAIPPVPGAPR